MPPIRSVEKHRDHLKEPPEAWLKEKLALFGASPEKFAKVPPVVISGQRKPVTISVEDGFSVAALGDAAVHTLRLTPKTLDELKELAGVPTRAFAKPGSSGPAIEVDERALAKVAKGAKFGKLDSEAKMAVWEGARKLLYGPVDARMMSKAGYEATARIALELARRFAVFWAPDLVVTAGQRVRFSGFGAMYFNNVLVYGNGVIEPGAVTKIHAYAITHV